MYVLNCKRLLPVLLAAFFLILSAENHFLFSQKILALNVYKWTGAKRIRFYEKDQLTYRVRGSRKCFTHTIVYMQDSLLMFDNGNQVATSEIDRIVINHSNFLSRSLSRFLFDVGAGFISLDIFNNFINSDAPIIKSLVVKEGAGLMAAGILLRVLPVKRYRINSHKVLKIIDTSP